METFLHKSSQKLSFAMIRIFSSFIILSTFALGIVAQTEPKFEVGGQFSIVRFRDLYSGTQYDQYKTDLGFGERLTFNLNRSVAVEGQIDFFPQSKNRTFQKPLLGVLGIKTGRRNDKRGFFFKARPGFLQRSEQLVCALGFLSGQLPPPCPSVRLTSVALDVGGVAEFYPSKRTLIRVDISDVMTRIEKITGHNFQTSIGVGWRF
jgi:hypothetical protein